MTFGRPAPSAARSRHDAIERAAAGVISSTMPAPEMSRASTRTEPGRSRTSTATAPRGATSAPQRRASASIAAPRTAFGA